MRLLFIKHSLAWPRSSGHDVHTFYMMRACAQLGHEVSLATVEAPAPHALEGLCLQHRYRLDDGAPTTSAPAGTWLQHRFRTYFGVPDGRLSSARDAARASRADAVIVVGLDALPYFPALPGVVRVWYAADEWVLHHLSQLRPGGTLRENLANAVIKGLYERAHRTAIDRVWVVSESERRAMRLFAGIRTVDVVPNGVDGDYYHPATHDPGDRTAVFWGRLDFGPNVQALEWFCRRVWPRIRAEEPDARFTIVGFNPSEGVRRLISIPGVSLQADLPDLRDEVRRHAVAVLPFVSGGGIKNKLLEAAALGLPIVCTPAATHGLRAPGEMPLRVVSSAAGFAREIVQLWGSPARRRALGSEARVWALAYHSWLTTARDALAPLGG